MGRLTTRRPIERVSAIGRVARPDTLVVEEPLEIRIVGESLTVTMRTPGHDFELIGGFLLTEGIITSRADIVSMRYCAGTDADGMQTYNVVDVMLAKSVPPPPSRSFLTSSACGVCGKSSVDQVRVQSQFDVAANDFTITTEQALRLPSLLRRAQRAFDATGGLHAAGLFTPLGELLVVREDVGRHNAVDKVVGWALENDHVPAADCALVVSGRASFELVQKAVATGIPMLVAVSAPSSLAVDLATDAGLTLLGFVRGESLNVYSGTYRLTD